MYSRIRRMGSTGPLGSMGLVLTIYSNNRISYQREIGKAKHNRGGEGGNGGGKVGSTIVAKMVSVIRCNLIG